MLEAPIIGEAYGVDGQTMCIPMDMVETSNLKDLLMMTLIMLLRIFNLVFLKCF